MAKEPENKLLQSEEAEKLEEKSKEIIRKLDKESATRSFKNPLMKKIFFIACLLVSGYHLYTAAFGPPVTLVHRSLHVAMIMALGFLMYPAGKSSDMTKPSARSFSSAVARASDEGKARRSLPSMGSPYFSHSDSMFFRIRGMLLF